MAKGTVEGPVDLGPMVKRLATIAKRIDGVLAEGKEFRRVDAKTLEGWDRELDRGKETLEQLRAKLTAEARAD